MENSDVSSANSFPVNFMSTGRSLIYIRKRVDTKWILEVHLLLQLTTLMSDYSAQFSRTYLSKNV